MVRGSWRRSRTPGGSRPRAHYASLLARPTKNPVLLVRLAERIEASALARLRRPRRAPQCLLQLAVHLHDVTSANPTLSRSRARLVAADRGRAAAPAAPARRLGPRDPARLQRPHEKGVDRAFDRLFTQVTVELWPDFFRHEEHAFWESANIWTRARASSGARRSCASCATLKIPENAEAIGRAASYGDLSENAEWTAAIEEQRNLTNRAMELETELENARLIESAIVPEGTVAPGTRVSYRDLGTAACTRSRSSAHGTPTARSASRTARRSAAGMLGLRGRATRSRSSCRAPASAVRIEAVRPMVS
jgi:hypothetical protein